MQRLVNSSIYRIRSFKIVSDRITRGCQVKLLLSRNLGAVDVSRSHAPSN